MTREFSTERRLDRNASRRDRSPARALAGERATRIVAAEPLAGDGSSARQLAADTAPFDVAPDSEARPMASVVPRMPKVPS